MKLLPLILLTACLTVSTSAFANVYIKTVNGKLVEVTEAELEKANRSAGLECSANPGPAPAPSNLCQPVYTERRGYTVFLGDSQLTDYVNDARSVVASYQRLVLRGTCQNVQHSCDLTMNGYNNNYVTINGRMASAWGNDRQMIEVFNVYRDANLCKQ